MSLTSFFVDSRSWPVASVVMDFREGNNNYFELFTYMFAFTRDSFSLVKKLSSEVSWHHCQPAGGLCTNYKHFSRSQSVRKPNHSDCE